MTRLCGQQDGCVKEWPKARVRKGDKFIQALLQVALTDPTASAVEAPALADTT